MSSQKPSPWLAQAMASSSESQDSVWRAPLADVTCLCWDWGHSCYAAWWCTAVTGTAATLQRQQFWALVITLVYWALVVTIVPGLNYNYAMNNIEPWSSLTVGLPSVGIALRQWCWPNACSRRHHGRRSGSVACFRPTVWHMGQPACLSFCEDNCASNQRCLFPRFSKWKIILIYQLSREVGETGFSCCILILQIML